MGDIEEVRKEYEKKLKEKQQDYQKQLELNRNDLETVIEALQAGSSAEAILELSSKNEAMRKELAELKIKVGLEKEELSLKLEKAESANFFGLRRNEEMGTKIFQMQTELEEMERKHKLETQAYKEAIGSNQGSSQNSQTINELVSVNEELEKRVHELEDSLGHDREKYIHDMELETAKVQEEKRAVIAEMTDKVLRLESIIDEMKEKHEFDIREYEERSRNERIDAVNHLEKRLTEAELALDDCKAEYEEEMEMHENEYKKNIEALEKELNYYKDLCLEHQNSKGPVEYGGSRTELIEVEAKLKEVMLKHADEIDTIKTACEKEIQKKQESIEAQLQHVREEYEEKLKSCVKESMRRQSFTGRKTESPRIKELTSKVDELELAIDDQKKEFEEEISNYKSMVANLQALVAELRDKGDAGTPLEEKNVFETSDEPLEEMTDGNNLSESKQRIRELENQIERYEKRIDYYRDRAKKNEEEESHRVGELQAEVENLRQNVKDLTEQHQREYWEPRLPGIQLILFAPKITEKTCE